MNVAPTLSHFVWTLPPEGAAAPAAWQSQFRGPCLRRKAPLSEMRGLYFFDITHEMTALLAAGI